jgi:class 3 adenylate cyclase
LVKAPYREARHAPVRRLAAILAADVAAYSRLMGVDEEGTHERLQAHLRELVNPKIAEHRGRVVKNTGDGFLAEFASVVDAVRCGTKIQRGMIDREPAVPPGSSASSFGSASLRLHQRCRAFALSDHICHVYRFLNGPDGLFFGTTATVIFVR